MAERRTKTGTLSAAGSVVLALSGNSLVFVGVSGTYGTAVVVVEGSLDGTNYGSIPSIKCDSGLAREGNLSLVDNSTNGFYVAAGTLRYVRLRLVSISSGSISVSLVNDDADMPLKEYNSYLELGLGVAKKVTAVARGSGTADVVITTGPGVLNRVIANDLATAALSIYDHASASSGAKLLWTSSATLALGTVTELNIPYELGLVAVQGNASSAVSVGYTPF